MIYRFYLFWILILYSTSFVAQRKNQIEFFQAIGISDALFVKNDSYFIEHPTQDYNLDKHKNMTHVGNSHQFGVLWKGEKNLSFSYGIILESYKTKSVANFDNGFPYKHIGKLSDFYLGVPLGLNKNWIINSKLSFSTSLFSRIDFYLLSFSKSQFYFIEGDKPNTHSSFDRENFHHYRPVNLSISMKAQFESKLNSNTLLSYGINSDIDILSNLKDYVYNKRWYALRINIGIII